MIHQDELLFPVICPVTYYVIINLANSNDTNLPLIYVSKQIRTRVPVETETIQLNKLKFIIFG